MEVNKIKEYLKDVYTLEWMKYTYQQIDRMYQKRIDYLEKEKNTIYYKDGKDRYKKGKGKHDFAIPSPESKESYLGDRKNESGRYEHVYGFHGTKDMFDKVPERWMNEELKELEQRECRRFRLIHTGIMAACTLTGGIIFCFIKNIISILVGILLGVVVCLVIGDEKKKEYLPKDKLYKRFMSIYRRRYNEELKGKAEKYQPIINQTQAERQSYVTANIEKIDRMLCSLYKKNFLQEKYQNIIAATQLYDYFDKQRCTELDGNEGAYRLFETESAAGIIFTNMEMVALSWDRYEKTMPSLVMQLKVLDRLKSELRPEMHAQSDKKIFKKYNKNMELAYIDIAKKYSA